jgi:hypothetical protein
LHIYFAEIFVPKNENWQVLGVDEYAPLEEIKKAGQVVWPSGD